MYPTNLISIWKRKEKTTRTKWLEKHALASLDNFYSHFKANLLYTSGVHAKHS